MKSIENTNYTTIPDEYARRNNNNANMWYTNQMKRNGLWLVLCGIILLVIVGAMFMMNKTDDTEQASPNTTSTDAPPADAINEPAESETDEKLVNQGRYTDYDAELVPAEGYDTTILFFHAEWCPECRAFDQTLMDSSIPEGIQLLKVDYDTNQELRRRYDVTTQTTFVRVDRSGDFQARWVGYGRDKTLDAVLENTV